MNLNIILIIIANGLKFKKINNVGSLINKLKSSILPMCVEFFQPKKAVFKSLLIRLNYN